MRRILSSLPFLRTRQARAAHAEAKLRRRHRRAMRVESLEGRALMAMLVSEALSGTSNTQISGTVYDDADANGAKNGGENGMSGWTVYLDLDNSGTLNQDAAGVTEPTATTDVDGFYRFRNLKPANYRVAEIVQDGWTPTGPVSKDVTVTSGKTTKADFFDFAGGNIVGTVWNDLDADGLRATDPSTGAFTEPGLAGWTVFLDLDNSRAYEVGEPVTTTDANGAYSFTNLPANDYEVTEILPAGWDVSPTFDKRQTASVTALQTATQDFANFSLTDGSLRGVVWQDANQDGVRNVDASTGEFTEPGLADWTVYLDLNSDGVLDPSEPSTNTDADGSYKFLSVPAGNYVLTEVLPSGWSTSPEIDSLQFVTIEAGRETIAADFANYNSGNGALHGVVWNDLNRNGVRDTSLSGAFTDPGLAGWTVYLDLNHDGAHTAGEPEMLTGADGGYAFVDLQIGEYEVREILPTGWEAATAAGDNVTVQVYSGNDTAVPDFVNYDVSAAQPASVSGVVWNDLGGDGLRNVDPSTGVFTDPGLAGWTVFADLNGNGAADASEPQAVSTADGSYSLSGLSPGTVTIVQQATPGWRFSAPPTGMRAVSLRSGDSLSGLDFGDAQLKDSTIRGTVFSDANRDGARGADERGLADITVYLDLNDDGTLGADEPSQTTSADLFYTPAVNEAGTYAFTHLSPGTYVVRAVMPATLSATPAAQRTHTVTITTAEDRAGIDTAAVFRANEIHGVRFNDANGNHQQDPGEAGVGEIVVYVDLDRDDVRDASEPTTTTAADGSYSFMDLSPGAYVVRAELSAGDESTYPTTSGGTLWPSGTSNAAVGSVTPSSITTSLAAGANHRETVSLTLPNSGALTNLVDVFLLFDDTGSFVGNSPIVRAAFPSIIAQLTSSLPGIDLGFGVGRFEEYGNYAWEYDTGRPFILNQPIVAASTAGYMTAIQAALDRTTPGYGGDGPETDIEALYQLVTGVGFDGNNNGSVLDSGAAGLAHTQLNPGPSGDVPSFASFQADPANGVLAAAGSVGGGGFRAGALPIILTATDIGFAYQPHGETSITGVGGVTLPLSSFIETSRPDTPFNAGAGIQQTVTALNALGALVIGLGTNTEHTLDPRQGLESLSTLTGAVNRSSTAIDNGTGTPIAPGEPLYFQIATGFASSVATGVVNAIQNAVTNVAVNIDLRASDPRVKIINHTGTINNVGAGQTASFDVEFVGDGAPHRFDLQFVRAGTNVVLGSIPVVIGTPIPGTGYEFEDLEDGEIEMHGDFGARAASTGGNSAPTATGDTYSLLEDTTLTVAAAGVLANDADVDGDSLAAILVSGPSHGTLSLAADGSFSYTPTDNYNGPDSFTYKASDGSLASNTVTVDLTITSVNDAPVATGESYSLAEDTTLTVAAAGVLANDADVDGDSLAAILVSGPSHGTLSLAADGSFSYTPAADYNGVDSFTYEASDGSLASNVVTVDLTITSVNDAPVATGESYSLAEDTTLTVAAAGVLANDADVDGDSLAAILVSGPSHGTLSLAADGSFSYTPAADYNGPDSFTYKASDGSLASNVVTVDLTINSVNDAPVATGESYWLAEDTTLTVVPSGVLANDSDVEGDALVAVLMTDSSHGTLVLNANGSFSYTPTADYFGADSFTYLVSDGSLASNVVTVDLTISSVNDAPVAQGESYSLTEDTTLAVAAAGVLANDSDVEGDPLAAILVSGPSHGTLSLAADGSFLYTPAANYAGADSFTYQASDGSLASSAVTVDLTITGVNDAPIATGESYSVVNDSTLNVAASGVLANDSDVEGAPLAAVLASGPSHGTLTLNANGSFTYVPAANYVGLDSFTYRASDGSANSELATVTIDVTAPGTKFIVIDATSRAAFQYSATGGLVANPALHAQDQTPMGVTANAAGTLSWVVDARGAIFVYDGAGRSVASYAVKGLDKPEGIATDGTHLWIVDRGRQRMYFFADGAAHRTGELRPTSSFPLSRGNAAAKDVTTDGVHLWVVNDTKKLDQVFRYTIAGTLDATWTIDKANAQPTGLTIDPNHVDDLWIVDAKSDRVYQYSAATSRTTGSQDASASFALASRNGNPQGIADPRPFTIGSRIVETVDAHAEALRQVVTEHADAISDSVLDHVATGWKRFRSRRGR